MCAIIRIFNNTMNMIGHNHHFMTPFAGIFIFNFPVPFFHHPTGTVQLHFFVLNLAKQTGPVSYTDGNEIQS